MALRFVDPDTTRLELSDGDWLEVKTRLAFGAAEKMRTAALHMKRKTGDDDSIDIKIDSYAIERMVAYIVDWSFRTNDGKAVRPGRDAYAALTEAAAKEIDEALDRHITEQTEVAKDADTDPTPLAIDSPSWSVAT